MPRKSINTGHLVSPRLGYKRGLAEDRVVAPYASILALPFAPQAVMQDLGAFEKLKMWGLYGLYESIDFTPERLKTGEHYAIIRSFMVHHQGMVLMSLNNYLFNKRMIRRFHADPRIESIELLLQEQIPANAPTEHPRPQPMDSMRGTYTSISLEPWRVSPDAPYTQVHCLSNGKYSLLISAAGSGFSRWGDIELTRWRALIPPWIIGEVGSTWKTAKANSYGLQRANQPCFRLIEMKDASTLTALNSSGSMEILSCAPV